MSLQELFASPPARRFEAVATSSRYLDMPDGVQIAVDIMLPAGIGPAERLPTLMLMARYWRSMELRMPSQPKRAPIGPRENTVDEFVRRGFAIVAMDARGTGASTGVSRTPFSAQEVQDYGEVARWIISQPWSNGHIGAYGISYEGATALRLASTGVDGVRGVVPQEIEYDVYADIALPGGIFNQAFIRMWSESNQRLDSNRTSSLFPAAARLIVKGVRPVDSDKASRAVLRQALADHQANTDVFAAISGVTFRDDHFGNTGVTLDDFSVPARQAALAAGGTALFNWGSWLDGATAEAALRTHYTLPNPQITVIGAWKHEMTAHGSPYLPPKSPPDPPPPAQLDAMAQFFQQVLVDQQPPQGKTLYYTTLGEHTWKRAASFPPPEATAHTWYFQPGGKLAPTPPDAAGADRYTVRPEATTGTTNRWHTQMARPVHYPDRAQADQMLLTYTSAPLERDLEVSGYPVLTLHLASTHDDGAFFAYLEDVDEAGVVRYVTEGQLRGLHRQLGDAAPYVTGMPYHPCTRAAAAPLPPGETVELVIGLQPTSALFRRGHRIRVALAGADKDTFSAIPAQGTPTWTVQRGLGAASAIRLPVIAR